MATLYKDLQKRIPWIEFVHGIPDYLHSPQFINPGKRNLIIFDDVMTEVKCDQRITDLFTKGSHHRNISIVYLTQNVFPQGKACRDTEIYLLCTLHKTCFLKVKRAGILL